MYLAIKNAHMSFAFISITLFLLRVIWSMRKSSMLHKTWVRVVPHVNDSLLLMCAVYLMLVTQQFPIVDNWLTVKMVALLVYIGLGMAAFKQEKTPGKRVLFALCALAVFAYIVAVALSKSPIF
ncbi:MAG: SirB2 family protein [Arenicella sp.]